MKQIEGQEKVTSIFGRWPSFHDAEVLSVNYERTEAGFDIQLSIHVWETLAQLDARGRFVHCYSSRVALRFVECDQESLRGFNGQNVLGGLSLEWPQDGIVRAGFEGLYGLGGSIYCRTLMVVDAVPWPAQVSATH